METVSNAMTNPSPTPFPQAGNTPHAAFQTKKHLFFCVFYQKYIHAAAFLKVTTLLNGWLEIFLFGSFFLNEESNLTNCFATYCITIE